MWIIKHYCIWSINLNFQEDWLDGCCYYRNLTIQLFIHLEEVTWWLIISADWRVENNQKMDLDELPDSSIFQIQVEMSDNWYDQMLSFLTEGMFPSAMRKDKKKKLALKSRSFMIIAGVLYKRGIDQVIRRCVPDFEKTIVLKEAHQGIAGGHFSREITGRKIFQAGLWWPIVFKGCT